MVEFKVRKTETWVYSIDKFYKNKFVKTISQNLNYSLSNEKELNEFIKQINSENSNKEIIEWLTLLYNKKYWIDDEIWLLLDFDDLSSEEEYLKEVVGRMTDYCNRYNELRFIDEYNNQFDIDKNWVKENYPEHEIINLKYNDLDTRRNKIQHLFPMNWLNKDFTVDSIVRWIESCKEKYWTKSIHLWYKFDWAACSVIYEKWKKWTYEFSKAVTRWNWIEWDDISENFKRIKNFNNFDILRWITTEILEWTDRIELRWEILVQKSEFERNDFWIKNTRQYAAWSIKLKDSDEVEKRNLVFSCYTMILSNKWKRVFFDRNHFNNQYWFENYLNSVWIYQKDIINSNEICNLEINVTNSNYQKQIEKFTTIFYDSRDNIDVDIDWLVFKINEYEYQIEAWQDYAMAYKFPSENSITKVIWIEFQIWRTWRVTPVLEYEPVDILWVTCTRATLHNSDYFDEYELCIWDEISVARNWDVIPQVQNILKRNWWKKISFIENCTICWSKLERDWSFHYCKNHLCWAKSDWAIFSFINSIWLNFLWTTKIQEMIEKWILKRQFDILYVTREELLKLDRSWDRTVDKILNSLEECKKELTFSNILDWLWVQWLGWTNSYKISTYFSEIENKSNENKFVLFKNNLEEIQNINWIWWSLLSNIENYLSNLNEEWIEYIKKVVEDFNIEFDKEEKVEWWKLEWKSFYITWKLSLSRWEFAEEYIYKNWWTEESLKKCDYFLAWLNATWWKVEEAKNLWKKVINEQEFFEMIS